MLVFLGHGCDIHKTYRKKGNSVVLHGNRNGESLNRYSQHAFMINYLVNSWYPACSQVTLNFIIQKFCSFILCFIVPPRPTPHTNLDPHPPLEGEKTKAKGKQFATVPHQVTGTGLPSAQNKVQIKHLANICMVSSAVKIHPFAHKSTQLQLRE